MTVEEFNRLFEKTGLDPSKTHLCIEYDTFRYSRVENITILDSTYLDIQGPAVLLYPKYLHNF